MTPQVRQALGKVLERGPGPHCETDFLKELHPGQMVWDWSPLDLYLRHFDLMTALYELQEELASQGLYLHIHFMRTWLTPWPEGGQCRHFADDSGRYCGSPAGPENLCAFHLKGKEGALESLSLKYFYLDPKNREALDEQTAEDFLSGTWELLGRAGETDQAFKTLGLPGNADLKMVRRRFRDLAQVHHPDHSCGNSQEFLEINRAYRLLSGIMEKMEGVLKP